MSYYLYLLTFDAPVHFGDTSLGGGLEQSGWEFSSDKLFSSLCTELAANGEAAAIDELMSMAEKGQFHISDLFPYQVQDNGEWELYLPIPFKHIEGRVQAKHLSMQEAKELSRLRKVAKKQLYYRASDFSSLCTAMHNGEFFTAQNELQLGCDEIVERVNCRGEKPLPYFIKNFSFAENTGLYGLVELPDDKQEWFQQLLTSLGLAGIGGKRTSGYGRFHLADDMFYLDEEYASDFEDTAALYRLLTQSSDSYMNISALLPGDGEAAVVAKGQYKLRKCSGFTGGTKRDSIYMLEAGSCLPKKLAGKIVCLGNMDKHPVYRYGMGMYVGLTL